MTNEQLAAAIKTGKHELMEELYSQTVKLLEWYLQREMAPESRKERARCVGVDMDDIRQECYFALEEAVKTYTPESGKPFSSFLRLNVRKCVGNALCVRSEKQLNDPSIAAIRLDEPFRDGDDRTAHDVCADPYAEAEIDNVVETIFREGLHDTLEECLAQLPSLEESVIRARYCDDLSVEETSRRERITSKRICALTKQGLSRLRTMKGIEEYRAEIIGRYAYRGGYRSFKNTGSSVVEIAAIKLVELDERIADADVWAAIRTVEE